MYDLEPLTELYKESCGRTFYCQSLKLDVFFVTASWRHVTFFFFLNKNSVFHDQAGYSYFSAEERRILITHCVGEAYKKLNSSEYDHLRLRLWQKTGHLITADGTDDDLTKPEGLKSYVLPQPAFLQPSASLPQVEENSVSGEEHTTVSEEDADTVDPSEEQPSYSGTQEDNLEDRVYDDDLVGRKVTVLYENGWFTGTIVYFNTKLKEYKVDYADETYLLSDDYDGVEVILEQERRQGSLHDIHAFTVYSVCITFYLNCWYDVDHMHRTSFYRFVSW